MAIECFLGCLCGSVHAGGGGGLCNCCWLQHKGLVTAHAAQAQFVLHPGSPSHSSEAYRYRFQSLGALGTLPLQAQEASARGAAPRAREGRAGGHLGTTRSRAWVWAVSSGVSSRTVGWNRKQHQNPRRYMNGSTSVCFMPPDTGRRVST